MPAIEEIPGPHRFFFFSFDCNEPEHIHMIVAHLDTLLEAWDEHCG